MKNHFPKHRDKLLFTLGVFCLSYWFFDFMNMVFLIKKPEFALWYSSAGLLLTGIALILESPILISIMFCALFAVELFWSLDFLGKIFFDQNFLGLTTYLFEPSYSKKDFFMALYHIYIPPILLVSLLHVKKVFRYSWVGSTIYALTLTVLTFFFARPTESVNCVHSLQQCKGAFAYILTKLPSPYHILTTIALLVVLVFIPINSTLLSIGRRRKWEEV